MDPKRQLWAGGCRGALMARAPDCLSGLEVSPRGWGRCPAAAGAEVCGELPPVLRAVRGSGGRGLRAVDFVPKTGWSPTYRYGYYPVRKGKRISRLS